MSGQPQPQPQPQSQSSPSSNDFIYKASFLTSPLINKPTIDEIFRQLDLGYKPRIFVAISAREEIPALFTAQLINMQKLYSDYIETILFDFAQPVDVSRNTLFTKFLIDTPQATHIFFLDTDVIIPDDAIPRLLAVEKMNAYICSGLLVKKNPPHFPLANVKYGPSTYKPIIRWPNNVDYVAIDSVGFGCVMIKRRVVQDVQYPFAQSSAHQSEDYWFFEQAKAVGYQPVLALKVLCGHLGSYLYTIKDAMPYLTQETKLMDRLSVNQEEERKANPREKPNEAQR